jgi:hypothetical protein
MKYIVKSLIDGKSEKTEHTTKEAAKAKLDKVKEAKTKATGKGFYHMHECHHDEGGRCKTLEKQEW